MAVRVNKTTTGHTLKDRHCICVRTSKPTNIYALKLLLLIIQLRTGIIHNPYLVLARIVDAVFELDKCTHKEDGRAASGAEDGLGLLYHLNNGEEKKKKRHSQLLSTAVGHIAAGRNG